jgi:hypothetical protein
MASRSPLNALFTTQVCGPISVSRVIFRVDANLQTQGVCPNGKGRRSVCRVPVPHLVCGGDAGLGRDKQTHDCSVALSSSLDQRRIAGLLYFPPAPSTTNTVLILFQSQATTQASLLVSIARIPHKPSSLRTFRTKSDSLHSPLLKRARANTALCRTGRGAPGPTARGWLRPQ